MVAIEGARVSRGNLLLGIANNNRPSRLVDVSFLAGLTKKMRFGAGNSTD